MGRSTRPDPDDPTTGLEVNGVDLGDRGPARATCRRSGAASWPACASCPAAASSSRRTTAIGELLTLEARLTYRQDEATRKRWVRLLYQGRAQIRLVAEGSSVERFGYWESMFVHGVPVGQVWGLVGRGDRVEWVETAFQKDAAKPPWER